jgi:hypothetical protein
MVYDLTQSTGSDPLRRVLAFAPRVITREAKSAKARNNDFVSVAGSRVIYSHWLLRRGRSVRKARKLKSNDKMVIGARSPHGIHQYGIQITACWESVITLI